MCVLNSKLLDFLIIIRKSMKFLLLLEVTNKVLNKNQDRRRNVLIS